MIGLLRASYSHLVFDLSKRFTPTDMTALRMADVILLVAQLELTSLRNVVRMLLTLEQEEGLGDKINVVVNRVGSEDGDITLKKAEETIGKPIFWQVPNDSKVDARRAQRRRAAAAARSQEQGAAEPGQAWPTPCPARRPRTSRPRRNDEGFFSFR